MTESAPSGAASTVDPAEIEREKDVVAQEIAEAFDTPDDHVFEMVQTRVPRKFGLDSIRDVQVLCPMNRGALGCKNLNLELQKALRPNSGLLPR